MKKFILASVFVVAASSVVAEDAPKADAPKTETSSWFNINMPSCPACVVNAKQQQKNGCLKIHGNQLQLLQY